MEGSRQRKSDRSGELIRNRNETRSRRDAIPGGREPVRTLDGLHLATMDFLRTRGRMIELASYARRLMAASAQGFTLATV